MFAGIHRESDSSSPRIASPLTHRRVAQVGGGREVWALEWREAVTSDDSERRILGDRDGRDEGAQMILLLHGCKSCFEYFFTGACEEWRSRLALRVRGARARFSPREG